MNYKLFLTILLILSAISTIFLCIAQPKLHKSILVYSSEFKIVPQSEIKVEVDNIPTITVVENVPVQKSQDINVISNQEFATQDINIIPNKENSSQNISTQQIQNQGINITPIKNTNTVKSQPITNQKIATQSVNVNPTNNITKVITTTPTNQKITVNTPNLENTNIKANNPQIDIQKILDNNKKIQAQNQKTTSQPINIQPVTTTPKQVTTDTTKISQTPVKAQTPKVITPTTTQTQTKVTPTQTVNLTPQEEEIAWQRWRSNLQNQIMQDVRLPNVPQGTTFKFSFDVDKYGKITNVHTTSTNSAYTPYAIQYIAPVIKSYQGRSILNFPKGSRRTTTEFIGSFRINNSSNKYSTTQDYKDTERITR